MTLVLYSNVGNVMRKVVGSMCHTKDILKAYLSKDYINAADNRDWEG